MSEATERREVVLVNNVGRRVGRTSKTSADEQPGQLHLAFSVFLFSPDGKVLLQRRALEKYHFGGIWANACCSHPLPGEELLASAERRVREELGIGPPRRDESGREGGDAEQEGEWQLLLAAALREVGCFVYRAVDPVSGLVEHEFDHVLVAVVERADGGELGDDDLPPFDSAEVAEARWAVLEAARGAGMTDGFSPWFAEAFEIALASLEVD